MDRIPETARWRFAELSGSLMLMANGVKPPQRDAAALNAYRYLDSIRLKTANMYLTLYHMTNLVYFIEKEYAGCASGSAAAADGAAAAATAMLRSALRECMRSAETHHVTTCLQAAADHIQRDLLGGRKPRGGVTILREWTCDVTRRSHLELEVADGMRVYTSYASVEEREAVSYMLRGDFSNHSDAFHHLGIMEAAKQHPAKTLTVLRRALAAVRPRPCNVMWVPK
jgi:hypothetical protein